MTDKVDKDIVEALENSLKAGLSDETMGTFTKKIKDLSAEFEDSLIWSLKDNLAYNLAGWCAEMAQRAVEQLLAGNEDQMRRYLSCDKRGPDGDYIGWTGRSDSQVWGRKREDHEQHPVIHGKLFEQGAVALRKSIVDAHRDLLVTERILDLEDQVKSLVGQINKANAEKDAMWERVRQSA